jgi:hypothetical protein
MTRIGCAALLLTVMLSDATLAAQSELVIVKENTREYHRPACPVVRDGKNVVAMTRAQAEARGFKPHPACDPAVNPRPPQPAPRGKSSTEPPPAPVPVYIAPGDNTYHRETCRKLAADRRRVTLDEAAKQHWPCALCRPPIRKRINPPAVPTRDGRG